jgi:hypothetical protein
MTPVQIVLLVVGILVLVGGVQAAIWIPIVRRLNALPGKLEQEIAGTGERFVTPWERSSFHGSTGGAYGNIGGIGILAVTNRRVVFRKAAGSPIDIPVDAVAAVELLTSWRGRRRAGWRFVAFRTKEGAQVVFSSRGADVERWARGVRGGA